MTTRPKPSHENNIDWDTMAEAFDRWLPYIQPVADALIDLADVSEGHTVLDVASGTGEPSLTLARRYGNKNLSIIGVDGAEAMVNLANRKVQEVGLAGLSFQHMKAEKLSFASGTFDRVISRFGVMLFDDPLLGVGEMRRVLRHGGKMAIAVWGEFHKITSMYLIWDVLMKAMPEEKRPVIPRIGRLGPPGKLKTLLDAAEFEEIKIKPFSVTYEFKNFESYWEVNTTAGLLKEPLDTFSAVQQEKIKNKVETLTAPHRENGQLVFQNEAILAMAIK